MSEAKPLGGRIFTLTFSICLIISGIALYFTAKRFIFGIGSVANLNDGYPWGIWIAYDVVVGTAFACGGYVMALLVYVLNKGEYHPLVRPALLASMFGYTLAGVSVFLDIGRYFHAYNLYLPWQMNFHSVMFEVAMCIGTYILVLWLEFAPAFTEKWKLEKYRKFLDKIIFALIGLGVLLPTMHQSSLGTMMLMAGFKLDPLWHTGTLPLLFLLTAIIMGFAMVVFEATIASRVYSLGDETSMLAKVSRIMSWVLGFYLVVRLQNVFVRGEMGNAFAGNFLGNMFLIENLLLIIGFVILTFFRKGLTPRLLFVAAVAILVGGSLFRFNTYIIGYDPGNGWNYFPSVGEQMITYGLIAIEIAAYTLFVKYFPVFSAHEPAISTK
ncbi:Ni/Fe-hydrogenase cytochrome b subunit [Desulfocapsa sp. AH-315-G09]|uniref:Ni/Fe-hydrogenase cytochrome b subunit n=1 Tax=Desulfotalea psychrophila TaxID=84980 RepID=A0ABS3AVZ5_9BACT|nr:Ni/Fe-hydrogenase cytochrome b subunit [Desulfocapsa sp.]MBN4065227.1 Ni/Fe-hydrogenase cytochrome b subunit [Desulfocapsa sp. AH-315-G09]MBN4068042.1 Ni/Fe-hydrogenase cytochrome b subunit [Desulfotalea psychrophila]